MNESGFITLLGILIAIYPLLPKEKKLELKFYLTRFNWFVIILSFLIIQYIIFYDFLKIFGNPLPRWVFETNLSRNQYVYLIFLLTAIYFLIMSYFVRIKRSNVKTANNLFAEELNLKKYYEVFNLLKKHFKDLRRIENGLSFRNKLAEYIAPLNQFEIIRGDKKPGFLDRKIPNQLTILSNLIKKNDQGKVYASNILNRLFSNEDFIEYSALHHPYASLEFFNCFHHRTETYLSQYFSILLDNTNSVFYFELINPGSSGPGRFNLNESNKLLHFLFNDMEVSKRLNIYKPVGDKISHILQHDELLIKNYNDSSSMYMKLEQKKCPILIGMTFFQIMINKSMHQGIKHHMWLAYFRSFARIILEKLNPASDVDFEDEYPTPFHYLIYHLFIVMLSWYDDFEYIKNKDAILYEDQNLSQEGRSIVKSNILVLGNITHLIIMSNKLDIKFKIYIFEIIMRRVEGNLSYPEYHELNNLLFRSIIRNGHNDKQDSAYSELLRHIIREGDFYGQNSTDIFKKMLPQ